MASKWAEFIRNAGPYFGGLAVLVAALIAVWNSGKLHNDRLRIEQAAKIDLKLSFSNSVCTVYVTNTGNGDAVVQGGYCGLHLTWTKQQPDTVPMGKQTLRKGNGFGVKLLLPKKFPGPILPYANVVVDEVYKGETNTSTFFVTGGWYTNQWGNWENLTNLDPNDQKAMREHLEPLGFRFEESDFGKTLNEVRAVSLGGTAVKSVPVSISDGDSTNRFFIQFGRAASSTLE